jgi:DNA invertase Pin-like site-specific DNA recombinase
MAERTLYRSGLLVGRKYYKAGEDNPSAFLTEGLVRKMRLLRRLGWSYGQLAKEFQVDRSTAYKICKRLSWRHINDL